MDLGTFGRFKLRRSLGAGGMGEVYLARASGPGGVERPVAIKVVRELHQQNKAVREMFLEEAKVSFLLTHPNIVQTYEIGEVEGQYFLVLEYVDGTDLDGLMRFFREQASQPIPLAMALYIGSQVGRGLHAAHALVDSHGLELKIVHRDISPTNVLLSRDGLVKVADFGLAKSTICGHETDAGVVKGKLCYMAPEQVEAQGEVDRRADIFGLGVVLYEMLAGAHPLGLPHGEISYQRRLAPWTPRPLAEVAPRLPPPLVELVMRAIAADPAARFDSAREVTRGLDHCVRDQGLSVADDELAEAVAEACRGATEAAPHPFDRALGIELKRVAGEGGLSTFAASSPLPTGEQELAPAEDPASAAQEQTLPPLATAAAVPRRAIGRLLSGRMMLPGLLLVGLLVAGLLVAGAWYLVSRGSAGGVVGATAAADAAVLASAASRPAAPDAGRGRPVDAASASAKLEVAPVPGGGRVWIDGQVRGTAPLTLDGLEPGRVEVKIVTKGRRTYNEQVVLAPGASLSLRPQLALQRRGRPRAPAGKGTLSVNTEPWSIVFIDGRRIRSTPLRDYALAAGKHRVRLHNPARKLTATRSVVIRPGKNTRLILDLGGQR